MGKKKRACCFRPRSPPGREALSHLRNPFLLLPLLSQCPPSQTIFRHYVKSKTMLGRERNGFLCPFPRCLLLPTDLMELGKRMQRTSQGKSVRELLRPSQRFLALLQGLVRIA